VQRGGSRKTGKQKREAFIAHRQHPHDTAWLVLVLIACLCSALHCHLNGDFVIPRPPFASTSRFDTAQFCRVELGAALRRLPASGRRLRQRGICTAHHNGQIVAECHRCGWRHPVGGPYDLAAAGRFPCYRAGEQQEEAAGCSGWMRVSHRCSWHTVRLSQPLILDRSATPALDVLRAASRFFGLVWL